MRCYRNMLHLPGVLIACIVALLPMAAHAADKPNIIFVFSDEHRYQSMSHTEMPSMKTPTMDRMAAEGFFFRQCVSNYPVCSPYRAIVMTGRWPYQTGVTDNNIPLDPALPTVGKAFQSAGYRTGYIGKWHLGKGNDARPLGFEHSIIWAGTNTHYDKSTYFKNGEAGVTPKGYNATLMTDQALEFMGAGEEQPYFLMLSLNPPHSNFTDAPPEKLALYPEGSLPFRPNYRLPKAEEGSIFSKNGSPHYEGYHAHISAIDDELARLLAAVKAAGAEDNTLFVYSSDHGSMHGSHGVGSKRQPYEESLRIPMIVYGVGRVPKGVQHDALIGAIDMVPTLCGLAGIPAPEGCAGNDYSGVVLKGEAAPERDGQFIMHIAKDNASKGNAHPAPIFRGVRTAQYTYAEGPEGPMCLFDNQADPYQMKNLVGESAYEAQKATLQGQLAVWLKRAEDPFTSSANR